MSRLDIDNKGNIVIFNEEKVTGVSFLMEDFFDNSLDKLKDDIEVCQDTNKKNLLIQFSEKYENGEFDFISDYWHNDEALEYNSTSPSFEFGFNRDGTGEFIAHDVKAIHSGFWYATDNIDKELENISRYKHNYEGYKIAADKIDIVITLIKDAPNYETAISELQNIGLTQAQAVALMSLNINTLAAYEVNQLQIRIEICDNLTQLINQIV